VAKVKRTYRLDEELVKLAQQQANDLDRSESYIVESLLVEAFKNKLPPRWKPSRYGGGDNDD
jgi:hypothetical protein